MKEAEADLASATGKEKKEKKDVDKLKRELDSEARDERLFLEVLNQILKDRAALQAS